MHEAQQGPRAQYERLRRRTEEQHERTRRRLEQSRERTQREALERYELLRERMQELRRRRGAHPSDGRHAPG